MKTRAHVAIAVFVGLIALVALACGTPASAPSTAGSHDPPQLVKVAEACARISACAHAHDTPRMRDPGACVDWWLSQSDPQSRGSVRRCLFDAKTCDDVSTCMHGGGDGRAAAFCAAHPGVVSGCEGDRLIDCEDDDALEGTVTDCAELGATCREVKTTGGLVVRSCWSPQKCPPGSPEARCDGPGAVLSCRDGAVERVACRTGTRCEEHHDENGEATASCELPGQRHCHAAGTRSCDKDRLVECQGSGHFASVRVTDCSASGLRCAGNGARTGCYVPANVECDKDMLPKCEGESVVFCAAGRLTKVSCPAIGMAACDPAAKGPMAGCTTLAPK